MDFLPDCTYTLHSVVELEGNTHVSPHGERIEGEDLPSECEFRVLLTEDCSFSIAVLFEYDGEEKAVCYQTLRTCLDAFELSDEEQKTLLKKAL